MATAGDGTLPHKGGHGRSSGWSSRAESPITILANMELDMKTTTEQQGVATTPPAPLAEAKDPRETSTATTGRKKHKKHSYEDVKTLEEVPPAVPLGSGTSPLGVSPPLGLSSPPKQSFALPRQPGEPLKSRAKFLKGAGGWTRVGVSLDDSSIRSDGNKEEIKVRSVWCVHVHVCVHVCVHVYVGAYMCVCSLM